MRVCVCTCVCMRARYWSEKIEHLQTQLSQQQPMQNETVNVLNTIVKTSCASQDNKSECVTAEFSGIENRLVSSSRTMAVQISSNDEFD
jgi:hypothetical protein